MKKKQLISALFLGIGLSALTGCTPMFPGGLSEAEWNSLGPGKRAELTLRQQQVDTARQANFEQQLNRTERRREYEQKTQPSIRLSPEDTAAINALTN